MRLFVSSLLLLASTPLIGQRAAELPNAPEATLAYSSSSSASNLQAESPSEQTAPEQGQTEGNGEQTVPKPTPQQQEEGSPSPPPGETRPEVQGIPKPLQEPKRILGMMPNYRAVSAGEIPAPPTSKEAFKIATQNSFDYSSFVFTALTSLIAKGTDAHPDLGKGVPGLWAYTWRGFLDKTDGNYLVIWALPTILHQDERYFAMGQGSKWRRLGYSLSQVAVARNYSGHHVPNYSELVGRAAAQAVSTTYYPPGDDNFADISAKYMWALARDGATNTFREFWPDIAVHVLHRHP